MVGAGPARSGPSGPWLSWGDLDWSTYQACEARSKLSYEGRLRTSWTTTRWSRLCEDREFKWTVAVKTQVAEEETMRWRNAMTVKSTLWMYSPHKTNIKMEELYDHSGGSTLLFETRAGVLRTLVYRRRFDSSVDPVCRTCGLEEKNLEHLVLQCAGLCPRHTEGTTLLLAQGFGCENGVLERRAVVSKAVRVTKDRLAQWWRTTWQQHSVTHSEGNR
ncbi:hypothetical protein HPB49_025522 [Dermacentor silvarum]|uniref:Uncharacterized protein n=1 Tax=Dermacentor silvarum TaxID=543639 RepID=A0ACB8D154_DERSI|nr:hypothetical protein HPB49_025522 [Dermacentor silvarum]